MKLLLTAMLYGGLAFGQQYQAPSKPAQVVQKAPDLAKGAETPHGPQTKKLPDLSVEDQSKYQSLLIQQKNIVSQRKQLVDMDKELEVKLNAVNVKGQALQAEILKKAGLDPKEYATQENAEGKGEIFALPKEEKK